MQDMWSCYDQCPKSTMVIYVVDITNDVFQTVVNKRKSDKTVFTNINRSGVNVGKITWQPIKPKVKFESKAHGNSPKNGAPNVTTSVHTSYTKQAAKVVDIPSSSYNRATSKK
ncbi:hypothetical protein Tco_1385731 [Tanacetum coccineum]